MHEKNKPLSPTRFWQEIYIAAIRSGKTSLQAKADAQQALTDYQKLVVGGTQDG
jgi:hypothetical protein